MCVRSHGRGDTPRSRAHGGTAVINGLVRVSTGTEQHQHDVRETVLRGHKERGRAVVHGDSDITTSLLAAPYHTVPCTAGGCVRRTNQYRG